MNKRYLFTVGNHQAILTVGEILELFALAVSLTTLLFISSIISCFL